MLKLLKNNSQRYLRKITFFDWVFIGLTAIVVFSLYYFFKRDVVYTTARFKVTDENILYAIASPNIEFANSFQVGDQELDELGRVVSEITGVDTYKVVQDKQVVYLDIRLRAIYNPRTKKYSVRGKDVIFGEFFDFSFTKVKFKGVVVDFDGFASPGSVQKKKMVVKAQLRYDDRQFSDVYGVPEHIARSVKNGDEVLNSKGDTLVKVLDVKITPSKRAILTNAGRSVIIDDVNLKDVFFTLELDVSEINKKNYMYGNIPIFVGNIVPINTDLASIFPTITEIVKE